MWLINALTYKLEEFIGDDVPPYAILSHRWGKPGEEVSFVDMMHKARKLKKGWGKIKLCCAQALRDKSSAGKALRYAWIDTCCIDKRSSAELSEAINSMYKWYQDAEICYAYLQDIEHVDNLASSEWWSRGWTLQELLAPSTDVMFYGSAWSLLGTRSQLRHRIASIAGIHPEALKGGPLDGFNVATKMSWSAPRRTTREEDRAYSLLGIFNVNMPLLYGEGSKAFRRLQEAILQTTNDLTIFAWSHCEPLPPDTEYALASGGILSLNGLLAPSGVLAPSPNAFVSPCYLSLQPITLVSLSDLTPTLTGLIRRHQEESTSLSRSNSPLEHHEDTYLPLNYDIQGLVISNLGLSIDLILMPWAKYAYFIPLCYEYSQRRFDPLEFGDPNVTGLQVLGMVVQWNPADGSFHRVINPDSAERSCLYRMPETIRYSRTQRILLSTGRIRYKPPRTWALTQKTVPIDNDQGNDTRLNITLDADFTTSHNALDHRSDHHFIFSMTASQYTSVHMTDVLPVDHVGLELNSTSFSFIVPNGVTGIVGRLSMTRACQTPLVLYFGYYFDFRPFMLASTVDDWYSHNSWCKLSAYGYCNIHDDLACLNFIANDLRTSTHGGSMLEEAQFNIFTPDLTNLPTHGPRGLKWLHDYRIKDVCDVHVWGSPETSMNYVIGRPSY